jgi:putative addiction module component (TIGR02574 family)
MTAEAKKIFEQALALPEPQRAALIDALADSLAETSEHEVDPAWLDEVRRRIEEVRRGEVQLETLSEVRRQIRAALAQ